MKLFSAIAAVSSLVIGQNAFGANAATVTLNLPALTYSSSTEKVKPTGGTETEAKKSKLSTVQLDQSFVSLTWKQLVVYYYPFTDAKVASVSYLVSDLVEVGLDLGLNSVKVDKPKDDKSVNTVGVYAWLYPKFGTLSSEFALIVDQTSTTGEMATTTTAGTTTTKVKDSALLTKVVANAVVPLTDNLNYVGGIYYAMTSAKADEAPKSKKTTGEFGVNIATLRVTLN